MSNTEFERLVEVAVAGGPAARILSRTECLSATRACATHLRETIRRRHEEGESGSNVVHMLAEVADVIVKGVFHLGLAILDIPRSVTSRMCLCALGGYGRSELSPASDLDVCLLYDSRLDRHLKGLSGFVAPFLWDIGLAVGYSTRSVKEAVQLAKQDIKTFTSLLEGRLVCGESSVFARVKLHVRELQAGKLGARFIQHKLRDRFQDLPTEYADLFAPEPNIKQNAGGLRDFHTALWLLMMSHGVVNLEEAVAQGLITPEEHLDFAESLDFLWRIRNQLHFHTGSAEDRLTYSNQRLVAKAFEYESSDQSSVLQLMQDYYAAASRLRRFLSIAAKICNFPAPSVPAEPTGAFPRDTIIEDGQLSAGLSDPNWFAHAPGRLMEVYWQCARHGVQLSRHTERLVAQNLHLVNESFRSNELVRRFFLAICNRPLQAGRALRQAANSGLLGCYLPEFQEIKGVLRYEDFHHYPVDEHTLLAIEALGRISDMESVVGRCLSEALEHLSDPYVLVMAILLHDFGKATGEAHVAESTRRAREICRRIGIMEEDEERIAFLVEHHMLMNKLSQFRDTDDEHIVQHFVDTVKTEERLRGLFLLSFADLSAVGPNVWNDWKGTLLLQLYLRTAKRLSGRVESIGEEFWKSAKTEEIRSLTRDDLRDQVEDHLKGLGQRYFLAFSPAQIADHLACIDEAKQRGLATHSTEDGLHGQSEVVICTRDRHGLFSKLAGTFSSQLINVNSAAVFTRPDGFIVDCFAVTDARQHRPLTKAQIKNIERVLHEVLLDGRDIRDYVERSRHRLFALFQPHVPVQTRITFDNQSALAHTVIDIETGDRTGLLYDITRAIAEAGLDIATARIGTDARRIRDSFYVQKDRAKIESEEEQEKVRIGIHNAIHPRAPVDTRGESS